MTPSAYPFRHADGAINRDAALAAGRRERALAARAAIAAMGRFLRRALSTTGALEADVYATARPRR